MPRRKPLRAAVRRGHDRTKLLDGIAKQIDAIRTALVGFPDADMIPVGGVLCFVGAELPMLWKESIGGVPLRGAKGTAKLLQVPGPIDAGLREALVAHLAVALPHAS